MTSPIMISGCRLCRESFECHQGPFGMLACIECVDLCCLEEGEENLDDNIAAIISLDGPEGVYRMGLAPPGSIKLVSVETEGSIRFVGGE